MKRLLFILMGVLTVGVMAGVVNAQHTIEPPISYTGSVEENFDTIPGATGTEMPPGWVAGTSNGGEEQEVPSSWINDEAVAINDGSITSKGVYYNLGTTDDSDRAIGGIPTSSQGDNNLQVALRNDTGAALTTISIVYTGEQWRDYQASSSKEALDPDGSTNLTERLIMFISDADDFSGNVERLPVEFDFSRLQNSSAGALDGNLAANRTVGIGGEYTLITPIAAGANFYITWHDFESNGTNDHFLAVDDVVIGSPGALLVAPIDWAYVSLALLEWLRPAPAQAGDPGTVLVDVYFGSVDPNLIPGKHDSVQLETSYNGDSTGSFGKPLTANTVYYWRVDVIDPNYGFPVTIKGPTWSFVTTVPAEVYVSKTALDVSEVGPTSDIYNISLSKAPAQPVTVTPGPLLVSPLDIRVSAGTDDIEEHTDDGEIEGIGSTDLELGREDAYPDQQLCGMRFNNINIPNGATITSAYLEFTVDEADAGQMSLTILGELSPDVPNTFTQSSNILTSRPRTVAEVNWLDLPDWTTAMVGSKQQTPDIVSIISEITGQTGWRHGNSLVLMVEAYDGSTGCRTAESYDGSAAPKLHIEWTVGTGTLLPPPMVSPQDISVAFRNDDAEEHTPSGTMETRGSSDLELGRENAYPDQQLVGMRFRNINIPNGATITGAYIEFTVDEADPNEMSLTILGELSPDVPSEFPSVTGELSGRPKTVAEVNWIDLPDWTTAMIGSKQQTPDIASIISEITGQGGWRYGSSLVLFVEAYNGSTGCRTAESFDGGGAYGAPKLHIEWTVGTGTLMPNWRRLPVTWTPSSVQLNNGNWNTGAEVTVTAVDDDDVVIDIDVNMYTLHHAVTSGPTEWLDLNSSTEYPVPSLEVSIDENDCGGWNFSYFDHNQNCVVDIGDLAMFALEFGMCTDPHFPLVCGDAR